ncbi:MAG: histidine phosphatase family protein [Chloroflexi bacterium]|nr:histidine phosphatase family protein [Chloroflexota bacterium]
MLYLVRHCQTTGQEPDAPLTTAGTAQAETLAALLGGRGIQRIVSSTHLRARQSAQPLAARTGLPLETDGRLVERVLSTEPLPDWRERLLASWTDHDLAYPGGESGRVATARALAAIGEVLEAGPLPAAVVTHGNLLSLLLHALDGRPGFETWERLTNPDVFQVERQMASGGPAAATRWRVTRIWPG